MTGIAFVGTGFVADFYVHTLRNHPDLRLVGVTDRDAARAERFAAHHDVRAYASLDKMLAEADARIVVNLTNPRSHAEVTRRCLEADRHVYSEKPLAMNFDEAQALVDLARQRDLLLSSAPCSVLGAAAQTAWRALREGVIGDAYLVYAELDDGMIHRMDYTNWRSETGSPWPAKDEFEVGCTVEHAGYYVTWLAAFFGPAESVTAFASTQIDDKRTDEPLDRNAPDVSIAAIRFRSGVVARLTCSIVAPHNHELRIVGEHGVLRVDDCWYNNAPVYVERDTRLARKLRRYPAVRDVLGVGRSRVTPVDGPKHRHGYKTRGHRFDYALGVADLAEAIREGRPPRLTDAFCLHCNELVLAIQHPDTMGCPYTMTTTFDPIEPGSVAN